MIKNNKLKKSICLLLSILIIQALVSCSTENEKLNVNLSMQEKIESRDASPPVFILEDESIAECTNDHIQQWYITEDGHYTECFECGKKLSLEEKHSIDTTVADGYVVIDNKIYIVVTRRCKCSFVVEKKYVSQNN